MSIKLSICIPTYNRAAFLGEALDSVIRQATDEVEIVVSDNASTDNTEALIREYQARFPRIRYHKNPKNLGADRNFLKVVELAKGEYCWLLGSDDVLSPDAMSAIWPYLGSAEIYQVDVCKVSVDLLSVITAHEKRLNASNGTTYNCRERAQLIRCIKDATGLDNLFAYLSSLIVSRSVWMRQLQLEQALGSGWIHVAYVFQMMREGARVLYIAQPLVKHRTGNDSFLAAVGQARRLAIDADYVRVAELVFHDDHEISYQLKINCSHRIFSLRRILAYKRLVALSDGPEGLWLAGLELSRTFEGLQGHWIKMAVWKYFPVVLIDVIQPALRRLRRWLGMNNFIASSK